MDERPPRGAITELAARWGEGDQDALHRLMEIVYDDLRQIAHRQLGAGAGSAVELDTTALVHEAYLRLSSMDRSAWTTRSHFFAFCAKAMRRIVVDFARRHRAEKRGGARVRVPLQENHAVLGGNLDDVLAVEDAVSRLELRSERMARIVECRFFGGMSVDETAEALGLSARTVAREWMRARAYLRHALEDPA